MQSILRLRLALTSDDYINKIVMSILLAIGGWSGEHPTNLIEAYDFCADRWINVTDSLERPRAHHGTAFLNGYDYCVGGFAMVELFSNKLSTAERYRPKTNQWSLIAPMHEQRSDASCTTLNSKIYICGSFNGNECLQTCEYYTPETNQWTMITPISNRHARIGVIACADHVFAVGGFDGNAFLSSVEAYSPGTNTWHAVPFMMTTCSNFGIEVINDQLFVVGGNNGFGTPCKVKCYDVITGMWSGARDMGIFRSGLSCYVVSGLPNMDEYTFPRHALPLLHLLEDESVESN
ncbi:Kelch-like protein 10 [Collichthys lucidus]|uniref:Kelch-like protein 10 n=1 Tax=Collichthys lucidus TaxID=240159 RepID=A0A4U5VJU6_COLLU|nr:Kelch-like protein 10 [Collichthys lucidus]